MKHYYIVRHDKPENILTGKDIEVHFDSFEDAEEWANNHDCEEIEEIGGSWDIYKKCWWCEEWHATTGNNANTNGFLCDHCFDYLKSRGEI